MKYGFCPICGEYGNLEHGEPRSVFNPYSGTPHVCPSRWMCTFGEPGEHDPRPVYAATAKQAAEKYAEWRDKQYCEDNFCDGTDETVVVTDGVGAITHWAVESEVVREYHASGSMEKWVEHDSFATDHGTVIDAHIEFEMKDGKIFPECTSFERDASPEELEKLKKEVDND